MALDTEDRNVSRFNFRWAYQTYLLKIAKATLRTAKEMNLAPEWMLIALLKSSKLQPSALQVRQFSPSRHLVVDDDMQPRSKLPLGLAT